MQSRATNDSDAAGPSRAWDVAIAVLGLSALSVYLLRGRLGGEAALVGVLAADALCIVLRWWARR